MSQMIQNYELITQLSANDLTESWYALNHNKNKYCYIKTINKTSDIFNYKFKSDYLLKSYLLQEKLNISSILTPSGIKHEKEDLLIEYPYLNENIWVPLSEKYLNDNLSDSIIQICNILDLLHEHDLVHCDIKLSNFFINKINRQILLTDLEFIAPNNSKPDAILKGTLGYIAPNIKHNDLVDKSADYYALGILLERATSRKGASSNILSFIDDLKEEYHTLRSNLLLELLFKNNLIDSNSFDMMKKRIFSGLLFSQYKNYRKRRISKKIINNLFSIDNRVIGLNLEIIDILEQEYKKRKLRVLSYIKNIIQNCDSQKHGEYWICNCDDDIFTAIIEAKYQFNSFNDLKKTVDDLIKKKLYYTAFLILSNYYDTFQNNDDFNKTYLLKNLARLAQALNKINDAIKYYSKLEDEKLIDDEEYYEYTTLYITNEQNDKALEIINTYTDKIEITEIKYKFETLKAIIALRQSDFVKTENLLSNILDISQKNKFYQTESISYYYYGILYWLKGEIEKAIHYSKKSLDIAKANKVINIETSANITLSSYYSDIGNYNQSLICGKNALKNINDLRNYSKYAVLLNNLFNTSIRFGQVKEAEKYLNGSIINGTGKLSDSSIILYLLSRGFFYLNTNQFYKARSSLMAILQSNISGGYSKNIGKTYHNLCELSIYLGRKSDFSQFYKEAVRIFHKNKDKCSLTEMDLLKEINDIQQKDTKVEDNLHNIIEITKKLYGYNSIFMANTGLIYAIYICCYYKLPLPELEPEVERHPHRHSVSLFNVTKIMWGNKTEFNNNITLIPILKEVVAILRKSNNKYLYTLFLSLIGKKYIEETNHKLARKFINLALKTGDEIGNQTLIDNIKELNKSLSIQNDSQTKYPLFL